MTKVTKYVVRNNLGSILMSTDDQVTAEDFFKKHVMARSYEKVTITTDILGKKIKEVI